MLLLGVLGVVYAIYKFDEERTAQKGGSVGAECLPCQERKKARQAAVTGMARARFDENHPKRCHTCN